MDTISQLVRSPVSLGLSGPFLVVALVALFWWRAGSIQSVLDRVWRLIVGRAKVKDPVLKAFFQRNRDLEKFRFVFRLKVENSKDMHRLLTWLDLHGIDITRLQKARRWVDTRSQDIVTLPSKRYVRGKVLEVLISAVVLVIGLEALSSSSALLQMRESKVWFLTDGNSIHQIFNQWEIGTQLCDKNLIEVRRITGFGEAEAQSICKSIKDGSLKPFVKDTVKFQHGAGIGFDAVATVFIGLAILSVISAEEAQRIRREVDKSVTNTITALESSELIKVRSPLEAELFHSLESYSLQLVSWLEADACKPRRQRRGMKRIYAELQEQGYQGSYSRVTAFVRQWKLTQDLTNFSTDLAQHKANQSRLGVQRGENKDDNDGVYFRSHWQDTYSYSGGTFQEYEPAYHYGLSMAGSTVYHGRPWEDVETELRETWLHSYPESAWDKFKDAVRQGWDRVTK